MLRRQALVAMMALAGTSQAQSTKNLKPDQERLMHARQSEIKHIRAWSVPRKFVEHYKLAPATASAAIGVTLLGEDGNRYLLDDVLYVLIHEVMVDVGLAS